MQRGGTWQLAGPAVPSRSGPSRSGLRDRAFEIRAFRIWAYASERAEVLGLVPAGLELAALVGLSAGGEKGTGAATTSETSLVASWANTKGIWRTSPPFQLATGTRLVSFGATPAGGVFAVVAGPEGNLGLAVAEGPASGWRQLPAPPRTTATVAFLPGGTVDALAVEEAPF